MATSKQYAYYLEGNQVAIVEKDVNFNNNVDSKEYGPGVARQQWKSPLTAITDGLEVKYVYSPTYKIQTTNDVDTNITQYMSTDGKLTIADNTSAYINYATTYALAADKYIVLESAGRFNGLHKIESIGNNTGTNNKIVLTTKYTGSESAWTDFEETPSLYYAVDVLEDESFELDLPNYLQKALVYYVKAKFAEDSMDIKSKEYFMREFKKMLEKYETTRISGLRMMSSGPHAIR
tara:strand:- start:9832 stop:10536 length:705 start_codon:yes stop_codon:yes gene_type:complete